MHKKISIFALLILFSVGLSAQDCTPCHASSKSPFLGKPAGIFQKSVGVMDKGQVQNNTGNFGVLSSFHVYFTNALHWPSSAAYERQYSFGLGLMLGIDKNNVLETETQSASKIVDWLPPDDARGLEFSGNIVAESDDTPFMASSDLINTWPDIGWPGYFRVDVNSLTPEQLASHPSSLSLPYAPSQFTSDRDLFATYNDAYSNSTGGYGITVEQTAHSYGRPYAEDFVFWDFKIFNDGVDDLDSIYVGFIAKFRPDFDNHDYINFIDSDDDGIKDLVYIYDVNNTRDGSWGDTDDPMGMVGLRVYDTPGQMGITDFHHFSHEVKPTTDQEMWALMTSDRTSDSLIDPNYYFHGSDPRIDYTGTDSIGFYYPEYSDVGEDARVGGAVDYVISCGPFDLKADSMVTLSMGIIMGDAGEVANNPDVTDLMNNTEIANQMYRLYFQGAGPPDPPTVHAIPGDQRVKLYWDAASESSVDVWNGENDFEGYRVFRSTDKGLTWGNPITDRYGNTVGYHPIAQFDYTEDEDIERFGVEISGLDPLYPQNLGDNTGLAHSFVDSNLINGVEYWYCVSAYDKGVQHSNPDSSIQSYMNGLGQSWHEIHTVRVTPGKTATDLYYGSNSELQVTNGICDGLVRLEFEDEDQLLDHDYELLFDALPYIDEMGDTLEGIGIWLTDLSTQDTLIYGRRIGDNTDTNTVVMDGFILHIENAEGGLKELGWTKVAGDTCTFDWRIHSMYPNLIPSGQAVGDVFETFDDWRLTVDYDVGVEADWLDAFTGDYSDQTQHLPLRAEVVTDPDNPIDVTDNLVLAEFSHAMPEAIRPSFYSPLGWDLVSGGLGFLSGSPGWYDKHVDMIIMEKIDTLRRVSGDSTILDTIPNYLYLLTNNKPDTSFSGNVGPDIIDAVAPSNGDQFTIIASKPFQPGFVYRFNPLRQNGTADIEAEDPLDNVYVVPDPYIVSNAWETNEFGKKLMFTNLPSNCTIKIYTILGEHVETIEHGKNTTSTEGYAFWNMRTRNDQFIAPGVYLFHAKTPDGHETMGRFLVIK